jgi:hypothetical protein
VQGKEEHIDHCRENVNPEEAPKRHSKLKYTLDGILNGRISFSYLHSTPWAASSFASVPASEVDFADSGQKATVQSVLALLDLKGTGHSLGEG